MPERAYWLTIRASWEVDIRVKNRHHQIVERMRGAGWVLVTELAEHFDVTPETIRRDLTALDRDGALRKIHDGAISAPTLPETDVAQRKQVNPTAKQTITRAALARLAPKLGTTLLTDAGTTTGSLARLLPGSSDLAIITNPALAATWLAGVGRARVRILGGQLHGLAQTAIGPGTVEVLPTLRVGIAVLGANDLSAARGLSTPDPDETAVKRTMVRNARQVIALVDSTEVGQEHLVSFVSLDNIDLLVTDAKLPPALIDQLTATEIKVLVARS